MIRATRRASRVRALLGVVAALAATTLALGGCAPAEEGATIVFLMPDATTERWESIDRTTMEHVVEQRCATCTFRYANAREDSLTQREQAESFLADGADVLVLTAVDGASALSIVAEATSRGVPVIAYDRFLASPDVAFYVSFDPRRVGRIQGDALVAELAERGEPDGGILLVGGAATDPNAVNMRAGLDAALSGTHHRVLAETDVPGWSPDLARDWVADQLARVGTENVAGVWAANDALAAGAISALLAAGADPLPVVTGQDAELSAVQRIVAGQQTMTVYKAIAQQARTAAEIAVLISRGDSPVAPSRVDGVPAVLLTPTGVGRDAIASVLVGGGVLAVDDICTPTFALACTDAGLLPRSNP
ncbi:sugar ABC transporter substrate-binding protein [Sanguibacter sp. HDW7]|uniref:sugar ABC transporter substrate-binding protein n=1 Tax=Sanguibacter sp. HDW7 TaxID=2714931 RepID=UPI001409EF97|nr:substrate-binding domain-containing protein [Sanguibacter sp. HDW7]QIK82829.1 sugar ABC transporter substrate-binding protein [Sanguibacter sp. HDW7]